MRKLDSFSKEFQDEFKEVFIAYHTIRGSGYNLDLRIQRLYESLKKGRTWRRRLWGMMVGVDSYRAKMGLPPVYQK